MKRYTGSGAQILSEHRSPTLAPVWHAEGSTGATRYRGVVEMSLVSWEAADWQAHYGLKIRAPGHPKRGQVVTYGRDFADHRLSETDARTLWQLRCDQLRSLFSGMATTHRILVCGGGFGYLVEAFHDAGFANCWTLDNSPYVHNNEAAHSRSSVGIANADARSSITTLRTVLNDLTGGSAFNWVISESMLECVVGATDRSALLTSFEGLLPTKSTPRRQIIHYVMDDPRVANAGMVYQTLDQWVAERNTHSWLSYDHQRMRIPA